MSTQDHLGLSILDEFRQHTDVKKTLFEEHVVSQFRVGYCLSHDWNAHPNDFKKDPRIKPDSTHENAPLPARPQHSPRPHSRISQSGNVPLTFVCDPIKGLTARRLRGAHVMAQTPYTHSMRRATSNNDLMPFTIVIWFLTIQSVVCFLAIRYGLVWIHGHG